MVIKEIAGLRADKTSAEQPQKVDRAARRKARTRARLVAGATRLLAEKDLEQISIQEITEAADVGLGTFYNHFESKQDVLLAIADDVYERYANELDTIVAGMSDAAEIVCVSYLYSIELARAPGTWAVLRHLPWRYLRSKYMRRATMDMEYGLQTGRFNIDNLEAFTSFLGSVAMGITEDLASGALSFEDACHTVIYCLRLLGLSEEEAQELAARPVPAPEPF